MGEKVGKGGVVMEGKEVSVIEEKKGWLGEGGEGGEVRVDEMGVEGVEGEGEGK